MGEKSRQELRGKQMKCGDVSRMRSRDEVEVGDLSRENFVNLEWMKISCTGGGKR